MLRSSKQLELPHVHSLGSNDADPAVDNNHNDDGDDDAESGRLHSRPKLGTFLFFPFRFRFYMTTSVRRRRRSAVVLTILLLTASLVASLSVSYLLFRDTFYFKLFRSSVPVQRRKYVHDRAIRSGGAYLDSLNRMKSLSSTSLSRSDSNSDKDGSTSSTAEKGQRKQESNKQLFGNSSSSRSSSSSSSGTTTNRTLPPRMCLAIATRQRKVPYIQAMMASLLKGNAYAYTNTGSDHPNQNRNHSNDNIIDDIWSQVEVHILNSAPEGNKDLTPIRQLQLPFVTIHNIHDADVTTSTQAQTSSFDRVNRNYATLLNTCIETGAPWAIALEEDTMLCRDFLPKTLQQLASFGNTNTPYTSNSTIYQHDNDNDNVKDGIAFVKLFVSDRWDGFENKDIGMIVFLSALISAVLNMVARRLLFSQRTWTAATTIMPFTVSNRRTVPILFCFAWTTVVLSLNVALIGRQNLQMMLDRTLLRQQRYRVIPLQEHHVAHGQAVAYPIESAKQAVAFLDEQVKVGGRRVFFDVLLAREFLQENPGLRAYEVTPPPVQHLGVYSSFKEKNQGNFAFLGQHEAFRDDVFADDDEEDKR